MSLWWAKKNQLDDDQIELIEDIPLKGRYLILGPPGSGKTNILLRRAQFVRAQRRPNIQVLTYTRPLTEFLKTGCLSTEGREIFPTNLITTYEKWMREIHRNAGVAFPDDISDPKQRRDALAASATTLFKTGTMPKYDALFVDEAQDLLKSEVELIDACSDNLFFVGDSRQKIYDDSCGLEAIREMQSKAEERVLKFHYRIVGEICEMADRILVPTGGVSLSSTQLYKGPTPGRIDVTGPLDRDDQVSEAVDRLSDQSRVYGDLLREGDKLGVIVPRKTDRDYVHAIFEASPTLKGRSQVLRANDGSIEDRGYNPALRSSSPILILTAQGAKGLEFRAVHWLFSNDLEKYNSPERCYTVVTRAKTSLDIYHSNEPPKQIAKSYAPPTEADIWDA